MISVLLLLTSSVSGSPSPSSLCSSLSSCSRPLGLQNGDLPDSSLSASSVYSSSVEARLARLNSSEGGGAWCPSSVLTNTSREWLEVDLGREMMVTGIITQGRWDRGLGQEFAELVKVEYWSYGLWVGDGETRRANTDTFTPVLVRLGEEDSPGVVTDKVRVVPVTEHPRTVCLRVELCGCELQAGEHQQTWKEEHDEVHDIQEELNLRGGQSQSSGESRDSVGPGLMSVVIGVLVTIILVLTAVIIFILYKNSVLSSQPPHLTPSHKPDEVSHYSNDSYNEYSRPLLGYQHKILWDLSLPPPLPARHLMVGSTLKQRNIP